MAIPQVRPKVANETADQFRERMEDKIRQAHYFADLDARAAASQQKQPAPRPAVKVGPKPRPAQPRVRVRAATAPATTTKPSHFSPGDRVTSRPETCVQCGAKLRKHSETLADRPNTVQHAGRGLCHRCYSRIRRGAA